MKKILSIIITLFVILGCSNPVDNSNGQDTNTGEVSITLPAGSRSYSVNPSSFTIKLVNDEIPYDKELTGKPGETLSIKSLLPGEYTITVKGLDADSNEIMKGDSTVTVEIAKVAVAKIELQYTSGGINVELDLPALIEEPSITPRRIKRNGPGVYTYDENGLVSRVDVKGQWYGDYHVIYTFEDGKRTGAEYYHNNGEEYVLRYKSTIEHDATGREVKETRYEEVFDVWEIEKTITVEYDDVENTKTVTNESSWNTTIKTYDSLGREIEYLHKGDIRSSFDWDSHYKAPEPTDWYGNANEDYDENKEYMFKRKISYFKDTWLFEKEEIFLDDVLLTVCDFVIDDLGYYVYAEVNAFDGQYIRSINFSPLFELGDYFGQTVLPGQVFWVDGIYLNHSGQSSSYTYKYTRDFTHHYSAYWTVTFEEGEKKDDLIDWNS